MLRSINKEELRNLSRDELYAVVHYYDTIMVHAYAFDLTLENGQPQLRAYRRCAIRNEAHLNQMPNIPLDHDIPQSVLDDARALIAFYNAVQS